MSKKTIQCRTFSGRLGWHWQNYMTVTENKLRSTLRKLRRNNPKSEFRIDEEETPDDEWRMHARAAHAVGMTIR